jgi:hypothetical protein
VQGNSDGDVRLVRDLDDAITSAWSPLSSSAESGVSFVAADADLPLSEIGHPVVLVLEDSSALDGAGNPQATLRYWSGTDWRLLGLSGGGAVASDFIEITLVGSPLTGQTIVWDAANSRFVPGELVPE